jgi:hypothetical protein
VGVTGRATPSRSGGRFRFIMERRFRVMMCPEPAGRLWTARCATRMPGGVGGAAPRGVPLSRSTVDFDGSGGRIRTADEGIMIPVAGGARAQHQIRKPLVEAPLVQSLGRSLDHLIAARDSLQRLGDRLTELGKLAAAARATRRRFSATPLFKSSFSRARAASRLSWTPLQKTGAPWWIRTTDPQLRRLLLYPTELRAPIRRRSS